MIRKIGRVDDLPLILYRLMKMRSDEITDNIQWCPVKFGSLVICGVVKFIENKYILLKIVFQ